MKFKLLEAEISFAEFNAFIYKNCRQFLNESGSRVMFRGISRKETYDTRFISSPPKDRMPKDMLFQLHSFMDNLLLQKFGWRGRSAAAFCTGDESQANYYGTPYKIYPVDGYKFIWSPEIKDLYGDFDEFRVRSGKYRHMATAQGFLANVPVPTEDEIEQHFVELLRTYRRDDLAEAIKSGNEIMLHCKQYAAIWDGE
jgi:hypothetical protein